MSRAFHLVVVPVRGETTFVSLEGPVTTIGSSPEADVCLSDPEIAAIHARIEEKGGGHVLVREQLPLLVNGLRSKAHLLAPNDLIVLGKNAISYRAGPSPASAPAQGEATGTLRRLHAFAERVRRRDDAQELAEHLLTDVLAVTGASRGSVVRFTSQDDLVRVASATRGSFSGSEVAISRTLIRRMQDAGRGILVEDTMLDPATAQAESLYGSPQSAIVVPIVVAERQLGAIYVGAASGVLRRPELELLEIYASLSADLLEGERKSELLESALVSLGEDTSDADSLLIGSSSAMRELRRSIRKVAASPAPIVILGETGSGKELVAREIHRLSPRASGPFVAVNCGAIPHELLASELFGHIRGAFTQAHKDRRGFFRSAEGGTLFLDEIGEMPLAQQVALLRVLQEGVVTPVGAERSEPIDVRVLCATNRRLDEEVAAGRFRQDLLFRLAVVTLAVPPLRDRPDDAIQLAHHFLRREIRAGKLPEIRFSDAALRTIRRSQWNGNVRELEASVRRAILLRESNLLGPADLGLASEDVDSGSVDVIRPLSMARDEFMRDYVRRTVERFDGNRTAAAEALIVSPRTVFKYLEE